MNIVFVSLNIGLLAVFYTAMGGLLSYIIYYLFEDHGDEWEKRSLLYKIVDVIVELTLVGIVAFWVTFTIKEVPPLVPMSKDMDSLVDTYISAVFFGYSMFMFLDDLTKKIKHMYSILFKKNFDKIFPEGSVLDIFFSRKTDSTKTIEK
jgi:uncharacterized membrane-anchored protein